MSKKIIAIILGVIIIGGGSFFAGMKYGQSKSSSTTKGMGNDFANLSPEERQARFGQFAGTGSDTVQRGARADGGFVNGEILSKDDKSITVKLNDGGSKIVLFSTSTQIMKSASGSSDDLKVGDNVTASGTSNSDGSVSAKSIQLRPEAAKPVNQ